MQRKLFLPSMDGMAAALKSMGDAAGSTSDVFVDLMRSLLPRIKPDPNAVLWLKDEFVIPHEPNETHRQRMERKKVQRELRTRMHLQKVS